MQEGTLGNQPVKKSVVSFNASHGVNPGWGVHEERPVIPEFNSVTEIAKLALLFTLWSRIESFLYDEVGIEPLASLKDEKKYRAVLLESETYLVALLCLLNNEHYSAGGLVDAMVGADASADQRGNARKRILNRTLPIVGDHYGLIDYSERHMGNSMEYSICRSERLVKFAETHLVDSINDIIGVVPNEPDKQSTPKRKAGAVRKSTDKVHSNATEKGTVKQKTCGKTSDSHTSGKTSSKKKVKTKAAECGGGK